MALAAIAAAPAMSRTTAYFDAAAATSANTISTVTLGVTDSATTSGIVDVATNMLPGDFFIKTLDLLNTGSTGVTQQDFTYTVSSATGTQCSLLDATDAPTCQTPATPSAAAGSPAALLLFRCTADAAATTPLACTSAGVYVTQVYPAAGAGTQQQLAAGLTRSAVGGVATGSAYSISIGGASFTGGPLLITSPFGLGGPDSVTGADGQLRGLAAGQTDHLASIVYLPTQAGDTLANQASLLTYTWTATQRLGGTRS